MERLEWAFLIALGSEEGPKKALLWFVAILPWVKRWLNQHLHGLGLLISEPHDKAALFSLSSFSLVCGSPLGDSLRKGVIGLAPLLGGPWLSSSPLGVPWGSSPDEALRHLISHLGEYARAPTFCFFSTFFSR